MYRPEKFISREQDIGGWGGGITPKGKEMKNEVRKHGRLTQKAQYMPNRSSR